MTQQLKKCKNAATDFIYITKKYRNEKDEQISALLNYLDSEEVQCHELVIHDFYFVAYVEKYHVGMYEMFYDLEELQKQINKDTFW